LNEVLNLSLQPAKIIEIIERAMGKNHGKRQGNFYAVFSSLRRSGLGIQGKGLFSFSSKNPLLPLLFFSKRAYNTLLNQGLVEFDIDDLNKYSRKSWSEFLTPIEDSSLSFFVELRKSIWFSPVQDRIPSTRTTLKGVPFAA